MKKIVILGTGGNCIDILDTILDINARSPTYECIGFLDDHPENAGREFYSVKVLGPLSMAGELTDCCFVNGIGSVRNFWKKEQILASTGISPDRFETIIHPSASVSGLSHIGKGVVVFQQVTITSNVSIGNQVIVLPNSLISHDNVIGDYTCIAGGVCISGGVTIGASSYLGSRSSIIENIQIGKNCLIGIGSNVFRDVEDNSVVVGKPARFIRKTIPDLH